MLASRHSSPSSFPISQTRILIRPRVLYNHPLKRHQQCTQDEKQMLVSRSVDKARRDHPEGINLHPQFATYASTTYIDGPISAWTGYVRLSSLSPLSLLH